MNINRTGVTIALFALMAIPAAAQTRVAVRINAGGPVGVSAGYDDNYEHSDVTYLHHEGICDDDIPVILYIRTHSHYSLRQISALRLRGASWDQLSNWCGVRIDPVRFRGYHRDNVVAYGHGFGHNGGRRMERHENHDGHGNQGHGENGNHDRDMRGHDPKGNR